MFSVFKSKDFNADIDNQLLSLNSEIIDMNLHIIEYQNKVKMLEEKKQYLQSIKTDICINGDNM